MVLKSINGVDIFTIENGHLKVSVAPALGGKILSVFSKLLQREFLWINKNLEITAHRPGADYDSNFLGGIDELIPNDIPETIDGISYPDHGELWTTKLQHEIQGETIKVFGTLLLSGLHYSKTISLDDSSVRLDYVIENNSGAQRHFLWKLHAALNIGAGDRLITSAKHGKVVDPAYSRFKKELEPFKWPYIENTDASVIPAKNGTMDFLYLYDTSKGEMQLLNNQEQLFSYNYDKNVFPYEWLFASYGGFLDHYTAILEPCTNMPISVNEAKDMKQCAKLEPGGSLKTTVRIFAGEKKNYIHQ
jgi:hypothetical protein